MPSKANASAFNASYNPSYIPVAIITGGTAGIGRSVAISLADYLKGRVHIIIVGRNHSAAESIIASLPIAPPEHQEGISVSKYEFVQCDVLHMKNVHAMADYFKGRLTKVDFLVHCAGYGEFARRDETEEGIDKMLAARYYSRFALTHDLLPLLRKAKEEGGMASVLSVLGAGWSPKIIDTDDLGLKRTYTGYKALFESAGYNDLMVAELASQNPDIAFTHMSPGMVNTFTKIDESLLLKILSLPLRPLMWLLLTSVEDSAEYMLYALLSAKQGMYRRDGHGNDIGLRNFPQNRDAQKLAWEHCLGATLIQ